MKKYMTIITLVLCLTIFPVKAESVKFSKCIDGDTADLSIDGEVKKVRFLAVDTPETKHPTKGEEPYGKEASNFTCEALKGAKKIKLEYEDKNKEDKYGRVLAWVFTDGELLQARLVKTGLAKVAYIYGDYKYTDKLKDLEKEAKSEKLRIWNDNKEEDTQLWTLAAATIVVIVICIYDKKYRRKTVNKVKSKIKKEADKEINKLFK